MTLDVIAPYVIAILILVGAVFTMVGAIGLLKFNDCMTRLHAPTKVSTMGVGSLLLASMLHSYMVGQGSFHELLIMSFLFVTTPISAHFMAKVNIHKRTCASLPELPEEETWSTLNVSEEDLEIAPVHET